MFALLQAPAPAHILLYVCLSHDILVLATFISLCFLLNHNFCNKYLSHLRVLM